MLAESTTASPSTHQLRKSSAVSAAGGGSSSPYHQGGFHHYQGGQGYGNPQGRGTSSSTPSIPSALSAANRAPGGGGHQLLPSPLEAAWEHHHQLHQLQGRLLGAGSSEQSIPSATASSAANASSSAAGRRLLPSPGPKKEVDSDRAARTVRQLLAKHQDTTSGNNSRLGTPTTPTRIKNHIQSTSSPSHHHKINSSTPQKKVKMHRGEDNASSSEDGDNFSSALPGDSFPTVATTLQSDIQGADMTDSHHRHYINGVQHEDDEEDSDDTVYSEEELLKRLSHGQQRMEQIKRMLVNQRGFIVESLKRMAIANSSAASNQVGQPGSSCNNCQPVVTSSDVNKSPGTKSGVSNHPDERDRTIGRVVAVQPEQHFSPPGGDTTDIDANILAPHKTCPMCEASFPGSVTQEDFELHVMEHFNFEETETIRYIPPAANMPNGNEFENVIDSAGSS